MFSVVRRPGEGLDKTPASGDCADPELTLRRHVNYDALLQAFTGKDPSYGTPRAANYTPEMHPVLSTPCSRTKSSSARQPVGFWPTPSARSKKREAPSNLSGKGARAIALRTRGSCGALPQKRWHRETEQGGSERFYG